MHSASKAFNLPGLKAALIVPGTAVVDEITAGLPATLDHSASSIGMLAHAVALADGRDWLAAHLAGLTENRAQLGSLLATELPADPLAAAGGDLSRLAGLPRPRAG